MKRPAVALLIAIFISIVVAAASYFLLVGPKKGKIDKLAKDTQNVENQINAKKSEYASLVEVKNRLPEYEAQLAAVQAIIPQEPELPSLIRNIQAAADPSTGAGLPWLSFAPGEIGAAASGTTCSSYTLTLTCAGCYSQVVDFIYRIERLQRAVIIDSVSLTATNAILNTSYSQNLGLVQCELKGRTFTFAAAPGAAPAQTQQPAPKAKE